MKLNDTVFWLGSDASLRRVLEAQQEFKGRAYDDDDYDSGKSRILEVTEGVATVAVHGDLTNEDSFFNFLFGMTSYNEIRNAIVQAIDDPEADRILLDIDTPGGSAKGVSELSDFILKARQHKPVDTYISGAALSAGYWIASATDKIYGGKMAESGSIGVVAVLVNRAKAMKKDGYDIHVFRGGKYKALGNPYEELSDTAKKIFQAKVDVMEGFFLDAVSENRNIPRTSVKAQVGEGLTFFAKESVSNGLIDEVISFDDLFNRLVRRSNQGSAAGRTILSEGIDMKKKVLTAAAVAALSAGAPSAEVEDLLASDPAAEAGKEGDAADPADPAAEAGKEGDAADPADPAAEAGKEGDAADPAAEAEEGKPDAKATELVNYLKTELKQVSMENSKLTVKLESLEGQLSNLQANETALKKIANEYVAGMGVGLGMSVMDLSNMDTGSVLTQYGSVRTKFTERFKVGGTASVEDGEQEQPTSSGDGLTLMELASIAANKL